MNQYKTLQMIYILCTVLNKQANFASCEYCTRDI